jgi:integrase
MPLSDLKARTAKPTGKPYKLPDEKGLYLLIKPTGARLWRFDYRFGGKRKTLALGAYPEITLAAAREKLLEARRLLAEGADPGAARKATKRAQANAAANSFEVIFTEWFNKYSSPWSDRHQARVARIFARDLLPWLGARPISEITAQELLATLHRIEERGVLEAAHRAQQYIGAVFRHAINSGRATSNPADALRKQLLPVKYEHFKAITDPAKVGELLRAIDTYHGGFVVCCALRLLPLVFTRPGELRHAEWAEIDLAGAVWAIPAAKMKMRADHIVPLSRQALAILAALHPFTGGGRYVFPNGHSPARPMSDVALLAALRRLGYSKEQMTAHGFRAMARTLLDEVLRSRIDLIEHQLAHEVRDPLGRAYNRTTHLEERRKMMQAWADYLDGLKAGQVEGGNVVALKVK